MSKKLHIYLSLTCLIFCAINTEKAWAKIDPLRGFSGEIVNLDLPKYVLVQSDTLDPDEESSEEQEPSPDQYESLEPDFNTFSIPAEEIEFEDDAMDARSEEDYEVDESEESSESIISFNFLYYFIQKFKFSSQK